MLTDRTCPILCVHCKHGGQHGYRGHVINFPQDSLSRNPWMSWAHKLPSTISSLPILVVQHHGVENTHKNFRVQRDHVLAALQWLKPNNPCYKDITIDMNSCCKSSCRWRVPAELLSVDDNECDDVCNIRRSEDNTDTDALFLWLKPLKMRPFMQLLVAGVTLIGQTLNNHQ